MIVRGVRSNMIDSGVYKDHKWMLRLTKKGESTCLFIERFYTTRDLLRKFRKVWRGLGYQTESYKVLYSKKSKDSMESRFIVKTS